MATRSLILAAALVLWGNGAGAEEVSSMALCQQLDGSYLECMAPKEPGRVPDTLPARMVGQWQAAETYRCPGDVRCPLPAADLDHALQICERHFHHAYPGYGPAYYDEPFENACLALQHRRDAADLDEVKRAAGEKP